MALSTQNVSLYDVGLKNRGCFAEFLYNLVHEGGGRCKSSAKISQIGITFTKCKSETKEERYMCMDLVVLVDKLELLERVWIRLGSGRRGIYEGHGRPLLSKVGGASAV